MIHRRTRQEHHTDGATVELNSEGASGSGWTRRCRRVGECERTVKCFAHSWQEPHNKRAIMLNSTCATSQARGGTASIVVIWSQVASRRDRFAKPVSSIVACWVASRLLLSEPLCPIHCAYANRRCRLRGTVGTFPKREHPVRPYRSPAGNRKLRRSR